MKIDSDMIKLAFQENTPYIMIYAVYAFIICLISALILYFKQPYIVMFRFILLTQEVVGVTAIVIFIFALTGLWFGSSLYSSEKHFVYFCTILQIAAVILVHYFMMNKTGLQLNSKWMFMIINSILLSLPLIGLSVLLTAFEGADMR